MNRATGIHYKKHNNKTYPSKHFDKEEKYKEAGAVESVGDGDQTMVVEILVPTNVTYDMCYGGRGHSGYYNNYKNYQIKMMGSALH